MGLKAVKNTVAIMKQLNCFLLLYVLSEAAVLFRKAFTADLKHICNYFKNYLLTRQQAVSTLQDRDIPPGYLNTLNNPLVLVQQVSVQCLGKCRQRRLYSDADVPQKVYVLAKEAILAMNIDGTERDEVLVADLWMEVNRTFDSNGTAGLPDFPPRAYCKGLRKEEDSDEIVLSLFQIDMLLKTVKGSCFVGLSLFVNGLLPNAVNLA